MTTFRKLFYTFIILLFSFPSWATQLSCKSLEIKPQTKTFVQHPPSYFTKSVPIPFADKSTHFKNFMEPSEDLGTYIAETGGEDVNRIIRLNKKQGDLSIEYPVPGPYDPVPSPDGRILSVASPMRLYDLREFLIEGHRPKALAAEFIDGVYQSIAWLRGKALENALKDQYDNRELKDNQRLYRLVTDNDDLIPMIDFLITYKKDCNVREAVQAGKHCIDLELLKPKGQEEEGSWAHCGDRALKTLFISRKGTYLSGYETTSNGGTSKILDISKVGECPEVLDFAHPTGKIDFNDDENMVAFHLDYLNDHSGSYFSRVNDLQTKDVFVMDLEKVSGGKLEGKNIRRLSTTIERGKGCYYPSFFNDQQERNGKKVERVLCMFDEGNESSDTDGYSFRTTDITDLDSATGFILPTLESPNMSSSKKRRLHSGALIGMVWGQACNPSDSDEYSAVQSASLFFNISYNDCNEIANLWGGNDPNPAQKQFRKKLANDMRFEDDPRFGKPSYILENISRSSLKSSCEIAKTYQEKLAQRNQSVDTLVVGKPDSGRTTHLTGPEIALRKCTGCHHYNVPLNAALQIDRDNGISSFPNVFEFGSHREVPLMYIDASLERIGYDPLQNDGATNPKLKDDILDYLGRNAETSREMPPKLRESLTINEEDGYDEREILGRYLFEMREQRIKEIEDMRQQEVQ